MAGPRYIPERFRVPCHFCNEGLDSRAKGVFAFTTGWVKNREQGGGNAIALPHRTGAYACGDCIARELNGDARFQAALF